MSFWTGTHWEPETAAPPSRARSGRLRHAMEALAEGSLIALLVVGLVAGTTLAAGAKASSVWVEGSSNARSAGMAYGDPFRAGYSTSTRKPWVQARCYPNSTTVYDRTYADGSVWGENFSVYPGGPMPQAFELKDPIAKNWTAGGADCVLKLVKYSADYGRYTVLAKTSFSVSL